MNDSTTILSTTRHEPSYKTGIKELRSSMRGQVLSLGDAGYDDARKIWNGMIDRKPALIVRCTGVADIIAALNFAHTHNLLVSVRGGGHNVAGYAVCDDGLMLDLSLLKGIRVDPQARTVRAQPGVTWGELDRETQLFGLATPGGFVSTTGIAGLTLGGGFGWLSRKYGFTCDNLLSADVVTADGRLLQASATENAELFWGLRGGGGNFGVITSFEYQLHEVGPTVVAGSLFYAMQDAPQVLRFFRDFAASAPEELGSLALLRIAPDLPFLPSHVRGKPVITITVCYAGSISDGERVVEPLRRFGKPLLDTISQLPYSAHQSMFDPSVPSGRHYYWKSEYLAKLDDAALDTIVAYAGQIPSPHTSIILFQLGGAISPNSDRAAYNRQAAFVFNIGSSWLDPHESNRHIAWTRRFWAAMQGASIGGTYINFLSADDGEDRVQAAFGANYARLRALKDRYDPRNFWRMNQNIVPTHQDSTPST